MIKEEIEVDNKAGDNHYPKRKLFSKKPYWNKELEELWQPMHKAENAFLNCSSNHLERKKFLEVRKNSQCSFDKRYRFYKRHFQRGQVLNLNKIQTSNPKRFWSEINKLGPRRVWKIPMEVMGHDGNPVIGLSEVINGWERDFKDLFSSEKILMISIIKTYA